MSEKAWKALTIPYEKILNAGEGQRCFRLSDRTIAIVLAIVDYIEWSTRWHKDDGTPLSTSEIDNIKAWAGTLAYEVLMDEPCFGGSPVGGGMAGLFDLCWHVDVDGNKTLRYTLNGGCTWNDVSVCSDSSVIEPVIPPNPSDDPADTNDLHGLLTNCQIVNGVFSYLFVTRFYLFIEDVICVALDTGGLSAAKSALVTWLSNATINTNYTYDAFWAILVNLPSHDVCFYRNCFDDESMWEYMKCSLLPCMTGEITRNVMDCAKNALDGFEPVNISNEDLAVFALLWGQYLDAWPLSSVRSFAVGLNPASVSDDCDCDSDVCDVYTAFDWGSVSLETTLGWISVPTGEDATQWAIDTANFAGMQTYTLAKVLGGWTFGQVASNVNPKRAGFNTYHFDEPYQLCDLYAQIVNSTGRLNTRYSVAWVKEYPSGSWVPLVKHIIPIYTNGIPDLTWAGSIKVTDILIGGTTGGGSWTLQAVYLNGSLA